MEVHVEHDGASYLKRFDSSPIVIGTHEKSDLCLDGVEGVNRRHAIIVRYLVGWTIHDLNSVNGVRVNGRKVRRAEVNVGDEVRVGRAHFTITNDELSRAAPAEVQDWNDLISNAIDSGPAVFASKCRLTIKRNGELIQEVDVNSDRIIGYSERAELRLPKEDGLASLHCLLARDSGGWYVHDLRSERGVFFRGALVGSGSLASGDLFQLADFEFAVELMLDPTEGKPLSFGPSTVLASDASLTGSSGSVLLPALDSSGSAFDIGMMNIPVEALERAQQAKVSFRLGYFEQAVRLLATACRLSPWTPNFRKQLRAAQRKAVERDPSQPAPNHWTLLWHQWRTYRAIQSGKWEAALARSERGLAIDPWNIGLLLLQARVFEEKKLFDLALWSLLSARPRGPLNVHINRPAAKLFRHLGAYDKSIAFWQLVKRADPNSRLADDELQKVMVEKTLRGGRYGENSEDA